MIVNLLLKSDSFKNKGETLEEIYDRIDNLDSIKCYIDNINRKKRKLNLEKDRMLYDLDLFKKDIYGGLDFYSFIYEKSIDNDYRKLFNSIINKSTMQSNENIDCEICFFKKPCCLIFDENNLIEFYRCNFQTLKNGTDYFNGIKIHFENISLHDNVKDSLNDIQEDLTSFSNDIIKTLIYLNDKIRNSLKKHNDVRATLEELTSEIQLHASVQGKRKGKLNFTFTKTNGESKVLCCEPHVKYNRSEESGIEKEYYRMYFHTGDSEIENGKVLIAHIGKHL